MAPDHVLVPIDGSPLADRALVHALETFDCRVTVLNVVTPIDESMIESGVLDPNERRHTEARERAAELIERAETRAREVDRTVDTAVETGDPVETILAYADASAVDHIVMGGHGGETGLTARLLGTVATNVVARAPVTVTVVR
ncbi:universal stress protein [Halorussus marinus]|uniref:universal stress protein n=1 Tax=Halorussus marinus TaxID=2505976 RepID=UPI00106E0E7C|nr:universal stress protein [Halorussus marinus]